MNTPDRLKGIATFVAVAQAGSFTAAAERLNLSNSAVGKSVARLEGRLGARLFERSTRQLALSEAGEAYLAVCTRVLDDLESAETTLAAQHIEPAGTLRVDLPASFGRLRVLPLILQLSARYPKVLPHLSFTDRFVHILDEGIDLAVRIGGPAPGGAGLAHRYLGVEQLIFCASPDYLQRHGTPANGEDLQRHARIQYGKADGGVSPWLFAGPQPPAWATPPRLVVGNAEAQAAAVAAGYGVAQLSTWLIKHQLESGELVPILPQLAIDGLPLHLVWPTRRAPLPKLKVLIEHLAAQLTVD